MKLFLIIVGALVTAFILCLLIFALCLRWLTRNIRNAMKQLGGVLEKLRPNVLPLRIKLRRIEAIHWQRPDEIEALVEPLRQERFTEIGSFAFATDSGDVALEAFFQPADSVYAIVYQHPQAGPWLDLVTRYQDGSRITYCTQRDTLLDRAEHNVIRFHEGMPAGELLRRFLAERPAKPIASMSAEQFVGHFEGAYAECMDWMIARGGPTEAEIRRQCERRGDMEESSVPVLVTAVRGSWAAAIDDFHQEQLKERFLADWQPPAARWEQMRDRLVFVHDRLSEERLEALCLQQESDDDWNLLGARSLSDGTVSPREAFARWNARIPTERRYERIGELSEPLLVDVYLSPNGR